MNLPKIHPENIGVALGSTYALGLDSGFIDVLPTTIHLLIKRTGGNQRCVSNCLFCGQARSAQTNTDNLSRVKWPNYSIDLVLEKISEKYTKKSIKRVCVQTIDYPNVFEDVLLFIDRLRSISTIPISISCQPPPENVLKTFQMRGIDRIGIPLDTATEDLFNRIKGKMAGNRYSWDSHLQALSTAVRIFGEKRVTTHLITGLGETEYEMIRIIQKLHDLGVTVALFAFTPVQGTPLQDHPPPSTDFYHRIQVARLLVTQNYVREDKMTYSEQDGKILDFGVELPALRNLVANGKPFETSGCLQCNRPYFNERAGGPLLNFPRKLTKEESERLIQEVLP